MNIRVVPRTLYLSRHGQSSFNSLKKLGGDSDLTDAGEEYSKRLAAYINDLNIENVFIWTSWLKRTIQTAQYIRGTQERSELLSLSNFNLTSTTVFLQMEDFKRDRCWRL